MKRIGNFFSYIVVIIFLAGFSYFFHSDLLMIGAVVLFIVPFISYPLLKVSSRRIKISFDGNKTVTKRDEEYILKVTFTNSSFVPVTNCNFRLELRNDYADETQTRYMSVSVPAFGRRVVNIYIKPILCGRINACIDDVSVKDLMSLFEVKVNGKTDYAINVMPRRIKSDVDVLVGENVSDDTEKVHRDNTGSEIIDIREYVSGDSLKTVHWKVSAKKDELYVKERGDTTQERTMLLLELNKNDINGILDMVYTYLLGYVKLGLPVRVCWAGRGREQLSSCIVYNKRDIYPVFSEIYNYIASNDEEHTLSVARRQLSGGYVLYISSSEKGVTKVSL